MSTQKVQTIIDNRTRLLITVGAAMAANGDALLNEAVTALVESGADEPWLMMPIYIGQQVKERPAAHMLEVAEVLIGADYTAMTDHSCPASELDRTEDSFKTIMLIAAGSAMSANCEPCLNQVVPNLIEAGVSEADIKEAVDIGLRVKEKIKAASNANAIKWIQNETQSGHSSLRAQSI
jgi:alkylhydroperoxidase/carboxymuconolactone decarboxylase family protein YurZ